ncbi:MAG TPA: hypothetical protein VGN37_20885 [Actinocatenispora sp.]
MATTADPTTTGPAQRHSRRRGLLLALALYAFSPFVGEFVLGNQPITAFAWVLVLGTMYGGGAVLIHEVVRRTRGGWPMIVLLGAAYALVEEGIVDQMLFNPGYLGLPDFAGYAPVPGLGTSASLTEGSLMLHTVWSISVPIAVIEAFDRDAPRPWLGRPGLAVVVGVFVVGCTGLTAMQYEQFHFLASPLQFGVTVAAVVALVAAAVVVAVRRRDRPAPAAGTGRPAPRPWRVAVVAFAVAGGYWAIELAVPWPWAVLPCVAVWVAASLVLLARYARRPGWSTTHVFAVGAGLLLTYVWVGFVQSASLPVSRPVAVLGNVVCGAVAILVLLLAARVRRHAYARA